MNYWFENSDYTIHVDDVNGDDGNDGKSFANAKKTISSAVTAVPNGGTIIVWPGTYNEKVDIAAAAKSITLVGTNRYKTIISHSSDHAVKVYDQCTVQNLTAKTTSTSHTAILAEGRDKCRFIDCDIISSGVDGLYLLDAYDAYIKDCYIYSGFDTLYVGDRTLVEDSLIVTDGTKGEGAAFRSAGSYSAIVRNSLIVAQAAWGKDTGKSPPLYEVENDLTAIKNFGRLVLENCCIIADGFRAGNQSSYCSGDTYCCQNVNNLVANNCLFYSITDVNQSETIAYGLHDCIAQLNNCGFQIVGTATAYVFNATSECTIYLTNTLYDLSQLGDNILLKHTPPGTRLDQAVKLLVNKAVQNKLTGAIDYYDDDGQTIILTHTPTDSESTIERTPS